MLFAFILVPFFLLEQRMTAMILAINAGAQAHPLAAGAAVAAVLVADIVLPVPSSLVSGFAGAALGFWAGTLAIFLGMSGGCLLGYAIGRAAGQGALRWLVGADEVARARAALEGAGGIALILTRAVPVLAESLVLGAGAAAMPLRPFLLLTSLANLAVALAYSALGVLAWSAGSFLLLFLGLAAVPAIGWLAWTRLRR
jgi:3-dehydroquinate synthase